MRLARTLAQTAFCLSTMSTLAAAWPTWVEERRVVIRQDNADSDEPAETTAPSNDDEDSNDDNNDEDSNNDNNEEDNNDDEEDPDDSNLNTASTLDPDSTETGKSTSTGKESFDHTDPPGGASFITPDPRAGPALYKAGEEITFVWNYTNVLAEPTAVDVLLSCSAASALWTLTGNMSFADPATYVWDSSEQQTDASQPLLTEEYMLIVKDSEIEMDSTPENGYFTRQDLGIAIYLPKDPIDMDDWNCPTCSGGPPELGHQALGFAATMCVITALSFTWFVTGLNL